PSGSAPNAPTLVRPLPDATQALSATPPRSAAANPLVLPDGRAPLFDAPVAQKADAINGVPTTATPKPPTVTPAQAGLELPQPRIFGGAQEWRIPPLDDMLKDWERHTDSDDTIRVQGRL